MTPHDLSVLETQIEAAWEARDTLSPKTTGPLRAAVELAIELLDSGRARVAEKTGGDACCQPPAELVGGVVDHGPGDPRRQLGVGEVESNEEEGDGKAVVEAALHIECLAHAGGH